MCAAPACNDGVKNGNESGVDCGGSCSPCPTCNDGIKNQNETEIDCGGKHCKACPSCSDSIRNNGELFTDCYGSCSGCNYAKLILLNLHIILIVLFLLALLFILIVRKISNLILLIKLNKFFLVFRLRRDLNVDTVSISNEAIRKLESLQLRLHKDDISVLASAYIDIIKWYFFSLFNLDQNFISSSLQHSISRSGLGLLTKIILVKFYEKASNIQHEPIKFEIVFSSIIDESKSVINGLKNAY
jgi:hypothetical protein